MKDNIKIVQNFSSVHVCTYSSIVRREKEVYSYIYYIIYIYSYIIMYLAHALFVRDPLCTVHTVCTH